MPSFLINTTYIIMHEIIDVCLMTGANNISSKLIDYHLRIEDNTFIRMEWVEIKDLLPIGSIVKYTGFKSDDAKSGSLVQIVGIGDCCCSLANNSSDKIQRFYRKTPIIYKVLFEYKIEDQICESQLSLNLGR